MQLKKDGPLMRAVFFCSLAIDCCVSEVVFNKKPAQESELVGKSKRLFHGY